VEVFSSQLLVEMISNGVHLNRSASINIAISGGDYHQITPVQKPYKVVMVLKRELPIRIAYF
jgi:hypothetical protein